MDTSHDGSVSLEEFKAIFDEFDFHDLHDRAGRILNDIKEIVRENHIDLKKIFNTFDADKVFFHKKMVKLGRRFGFKGI